jgi:hypothetical protein
LLLDFRLKIPQLTLTMRECGSVHLNFRQLIFSCFVVDADETEKNEILYHWIFTHWINFTIFFEAIERSILVDSKFGSLVSFDCTCEKNSVIFAPSNFTNWQMKVNFSPLFHCLRMTILMLFSFSATVH